MVPIERKGINFLTLYEYVLLKLLEDLNTKISRHLFKCKEFKYVIHKCSYSLTIRY